MPTMGSHLTFGQTTSVSLIPPCVAAHLYLFCVPVLSLLLSRQFMKPPKLASALAQLAKLGTMPAFTTSFTNLVVVFGPVYFL